MDRKETFVSDELATMLMLQISHEQKNANLYAAISNYFDSIGLEGCHQWFKHQTEEETSHASMLIDYCTEAGVELDIQEVPKPELKKKEPKAIMELYLSTEIETTESIKRLCSQALKDCDYISFKFLSDFIHEQLSEENEAQTRLNIFANTNDIILADHSVGELND